MRDGHTLKNIYEDSSVSKTSHHRAFAGCIYGWEGESWDNTYKIIDELGIYFRNISGERVNIPVNAFIKAYSTYQERANGFENELDRQVSLFGNLTPIEEKKYKGETPLRDRASLLQRDISGYLGELGSKIQQLSSLSYHATQATAVLQEAFIKSSKVISQRHHCKDPGGVAGEARGGEG